MCHASGVESTVQQQGLLITDVPVAHQGAGPAGEELEGELGASAGAEIVDDSRIRIEGAPGVGPHIGGLGLARSGVQQRHRGLVAVQHRRAEDEVPVGLEQRRDLRAGLAARVRQLIA